MSRVILTRGGLNYRREIKEALPSFSDTDKLLGSTPAITSKAATPTEMDKFMFSSRFKDTNDVLMKSNSFFSGFAPLQIKHPKRVPSKSHVAIDKTIYCSEFPSYSQKIDRTFHHFGERNHDGNKTDKISMPPASKREENDNMEQRFESYEIKKRKEMMSKVKSFFVEGSANNSRSRLDRTLQNSFFPSLDVSLSRSKVTDKGDPPSSDIFGSLRKVPGHISSVSAIPPVHLLNSMIDSEENKLERLLQKCRSHNKMFIQIGRDNILKHARRQDAHETKILRGCSDYLTNLKLETSVILHNQIMAKNEQQRYQERVTQLHFRKYARNSKSTDPRLTIRI